MLTPLGVKLKQIAEELRYRSGYVPVAGAEHCPKCWLNRKIAYLRAEPHHNGVGVLTFICDRCGYRLVA